MSVFSILTIRNVRKSMVHPIRLAAPEMAVNDQQPRFRRKRDRQLLRLALFQVISYIVLNITTSIYPLYSYLTRSQSAADADQMAISNFISSIGLVLLYTYSAVSLRICI